MELIENGLKELEFNPETDLIHICSGNIFDLTRQMFKNKKFDFKNVKIIGVLQDRVERQFLEHLKKIGVKSKMITIESGKKRYFQLFNWVAWDFPRRRKYVKSGFRKWQSKWEKICSEQYKKNLRKKKPS
ncbi:MAG: hypothetical protein ACTSWY_14800 [Promethearchaeota archaeon]